MELDRKLLLLVKGLALSRRAQGSEYVGSSSYNSTKYDNGTRRRSKRRNLRWHKGHVSQEGSMIWRGRMGNRLMGYGREDSSARGRGKISIVSTPMTPASLITGKARKGLGDKDPWLFDAYPAGLRMGERRGEPSGSEIKNRDPH